MKKAMIVMGVALAVTVVVAAFKCQFCNGTGWRGNTTCVYCKGTGGK